MTAPTTDPNSGAAWNSGLASFEMPLASMGMGPVSEIAYVWEPEGIRQIVRYESGEVTRTVTLSSVEFVRLNPDQTVRALGRSK